ncbi:MAG: PAS domain-containing protein [Myxococcaceae bacterium]|nr:PAS domain-containing protein [Myxococcaceae bacterium]
MSTPKRDEAGNVHPRPQESKVLPEQAVEERLLVILGFTGSILFEFDAEARYTAVSAPAEELLAIPRDQLLGRTIPEVVGPQAAAPFLERIQSVLTTGHADPFEYDLEVLGGRRWFRANALMVPRRQHVLFLVQDITRQKGLEQHLLESDRLAALGTLAAGVAHEVNNPLSYVSSNLNFIAEGMAEILRLLEETGRAPDPDWLKRSVKECAEALSEAQEGTGRIRRVVADLKTFGRGEDPSEGAANVVRALEGAISIARPELRFRARLVKQLGEVPRVRGSESRLGQVFLNLLINAAQAIPEGAPDKNRVEVRLREEEGRVVVEIEDTGAGIPPEVRERIFDPFFSTKPSGIGTGLGLSICHGIVTSLGGEISVESTVGQGSCFRIRLPVS